MALRLRRVLSISSSLLHIHSPKLTSQLHFMSPSFPATTLNDQNPVTPFSSGLLSFRHFRSSSISLSYREGGVRGRSDLDDQVIGPDSILFEGCDYNHWLITMDFPENLTAEQKVEEYVKTAAKIFGSIEEAKKRIYACSTTVYQGFQVECTEETSEKFKEIPGVVFVLPDSYIDPVNKQYGGDKYDNGTIIPRPPPITYRSRDFRPRNQRYENRGPMRGDAGNFGPPQNTSPQQNFGQPRGPAPQQNYSQPQNAPLQQNYGIHQNAPPQQNYAFRPPQQNYGMQQHAPPQQNYGMQQHAPPQQNYGYRPPQQNHGMPSQDPLHQPNYGQTQNIPPQNFIPQHNSGSLGMHSPTQQSYGPPGGIESRGPTTAPGGWDRNQGGRRDFPQGDQRGYTSADSGSFAGQSYTSSQGGTSSQGLGGAPGEEMGPAYGPNYPRHAEGQNFSDEQKNYAGMGTADQGKH